MKIYSNIDQVAASSINKPKKPKGVIASGPLPDTTLPIDKIR